MFFVLQTRWASFYLARGWFTSVHKWIWWSDTTLLTIIRLFIFLLTRETSCLVCSAEILIDWSSDVFFLEGDELLQIKRTNSELCWRKLSLAHDLGLNRRARLGCWSLMLWSCMLRSILLLCFVSTHEVGGELSCFDQIWGKHVFNHLVLHFLEDRVLSALEILN